MPRYHSRIFMSDSDQNSEYKISDKNIERNSLKGLQLERITTLEIGKEMLHVAI